MKQLNDNCDICELLNDSKYFITETEYWRVSLCNSQEYLGRAYVTLKRHAPSISLLTEVEWLDLRSLIATLETALNKTFGATNFNWSCLMNDAYKHNPAYPHVHWHLIPRYSHDVSFSDSVFKDPEFGNHYDCSKGMIVNHPESVLTAITEEIKKNIR